jgi:hypothetical protein
MARRLLPFVIAFSLLTLFLALDPPEPRPAAARSSQPPVATTGAPGQGTCKSCHGTGTDDVGNGSLTISAPDFYMPGATDTITVTIQDPGQQRWGFELTVLKNSDNTMAGALTSISPYTGTNSSGGITYIGHVSNVSADGTFAGTTNGPVSWEFTWTAPLSGSGPVTFYFTGVAANGNGQKDSGDYTYKNTHGAIEEVPSAVLQTTWGEIKSLLR